MSECEFIKAYGVAPYQGLCVLAITFKELAMERIRNLILEPLTLIKITDDSYPAWESIEIYILILSLALSLSADAGTPFDGQ